MTQRTLPDYPVPPEVPEPEPATSRRAWRKIPYEERFRRQRRDLLDAAASLATEHGVRGTSVAAIAARAGLAKRVFYEHFADKEACFVELLRQIGAAHLRSAIAAAESARDASPYETVRAVIRALVSVPPADPRLLVATKVAAARGSAIAAAYAQHRGQVADLLVAVAVRLGSTLPRKIIRLAALLLVNGVTDLASELRHRRGVLDEVTTISCLAFGLPIDA